MSKDARAPSELEPQFWEHKSLEDMSAAEWEALCDGCGQCCLNKLEDEDTGAVVLTRIACRLFDDHRCHCQKYENRQEIVPECIVLTPDKIAQNAYWLPETCAYKLLWEGKPLFDWHPLISQSRESVHQAGMSVRGMTLSEVDIDLLDWENYVIDTCQTE